MEKQYSKTKIDKMTKQLSSLKDKSEKAQYKLGKQTTHLQDLINKLKNNSQDKQHQLVAENKMNQIKYLYHEYKVARNYIFDNKSNIDSTVLAIIYYKLIKATPKWLPESCTLNGFNKLSKDKYCKLLISKDKHNDYPRLVLEKRIIDEKYKNRLLNMSYTHLKDLIEKAKKTNFKRVTASATFALISIAMAYAGFHSGGITFPIAVIFIIAMILVAPKGLQSELDILSVSRNDLDSITFFDNAIWDREINLRKYEQGIKDKINKEHEKNSTPAQHIRNIKHEGTTWESLEKSTK